MTELNHKCEARGCTVDVPKSMFMCNLHWFMLPGKLREVIFHEYDRRAHGQPPTEAFDATVNAAIEAVAKVEAEKQAKEGARE